jgi:hypothetical protein
LTLGNFKLSLVPDDLPHPKSSSITATSTSITSVIPANTSTSSGAVSPTGRPSSEIASFCDNTNSVCIAAEPNQSSNEVIFTLQSTASGWASFGIGTKMADATMYMAYNNNNGGISLSQRATTGHRPPVLTADQEFKLIDSPRVTVAKLAGARISVSFSRAIAGSVSSNALSITGGPVKFIFAASDDVPSDPDSLASPVPKHSVQGSFVMNLVKSVDNGGIQLGNADNVPKDIPGMSPNSSVITSSFCDDKKSVCISAQRDMKSDTVTFSLLSTANGWAGFGVGRSMADSTMCKY